MKSSDLATPVDLAAFETFARDRGLDLKFTDDVVLRIPRLLGVAVAYLDQYRGTFDFLCDVQMSYMTTGRITVSQARGVLNCMLAEYRRSDKSPRQLALEEAPQGPVAAAVENGTYTIVLPDDDYFTLRVADANWGDFPAGTQSIAFLSGPENETDFTGCAFRYANGTVRMWKRFNGGELEHKVRLALHALASIDEQREAGEAYALRSGRCSKCGRKLTVPASLHRGMGPDCAMKFGL